MDTSVGSFITMFRSKDQERSEATSSQPDVAHKPNDTQPVNQFEVKFAPTNNEHISIEHKEKEKLLDGKSLAIRIPKRPPHWVKELNRINFECLGHMSDLKRTTVLQTMDKTIQILNDRYKEAEKNPTMAGFVAKFTRKCLYIYRYLYRSFESVSWIEFDVRVWAERLMQI